MDSYTLHIPHRALTSLRANIPRWHRVHVVCYERNRHRNYIACVWRYAFYLLSITLESLSILERLFWRHYSDKCEKITKFTFKQWCAYCVLCILYSAYVVQSADIEDRHLTRNTNHNTKWTIEWLIDFQYVCARCGSHVTSASVSMLSHAHTHVQRHVNCERIEFTKSLVGSFFLDALSIHCSTIVPCYALSI